MGDSMMSRLRRNRGWILWEILAGISIMGLIGVAGMSTQSSSTQTTLANNATMEASALFQMAQGLDLGTTVTATVNLTPEIVNELKSTTASGFGNMVNCTPVSSTGLCGPWSGSTFSIQESSSSPIYSVTLAGITVAQCMQILETSSSSVMFSTVNGLTPSSITPSAAQTACSGGSVVWTAN